ncbi:MAG: hypothetical protein Q8R98_04045 [Rubrivivax sp.]|nr:hypothetical protein [Rubrivivax sp.]MDP3225641.1 hypothetical protein [Rubrivivax sp.]MDP3611001.1 hypothetical protein [Rubrivivax sp.]
MNSRLGRAALFAVLLMVVLGWTQVLGSGVSWALVLGVALATCLIGGLWWVAKHLPDLTAAIRERFWARDEGNYHAFGGVSLRVEDDGRHVWLGGQGLLRVLGRQEADDVLAARMPGMSRRDAKGALLLRVDAVIDYLGHMPGRQDPRVQKLRRYLERDVLHPAAERRRRDARAR